MFIAPVAGLRKKTTFHISKRWKKMVKNTIPLSRPPRKKIILNLLPEIQYAN